MRRSSKYYRIGFVEYEGVDYSTAEADENFEKFSRKKRDDSEKRSVKNERKIREERRNMKWGF
jgi:hypothetical protein